MQNSKNNLYSRQIGAIGSETMGKLSNLKVFILELDTIGIETAKCLCLLGIKKLYINDKRRVTKCILGKNFGISPEFGNNGWSNKNVENSTIEYLKQLNRYVEITTGTLSKEIYEDIDVLVQTKINNLDKYNAKILNKRCRKYGVKYILGVNIGFTGYIFNDFGEKHNVNDYDGEKYKSAYIKSILNTDTETILELSDGPIEFYSGLKFRFIQPKLSKIFSIKKMIGNKIYIDLLKEELTVTDNILIYEYKEPITINHKHLEDFASNPTYPECVININDHDRCMKILSDIYNFIDNPKLLGKLYSTNVVINTKCEFAPIGSIIGSIISQEIVKITGKYTPINQELLLDYSEIYNSKDLYKTVSNKKYNNIQSLLSKSHIKYLQKLNIFLVGCGALGCEYLKLFSMLDISTHKNGKITVTDMDNIELSNLNRQFLFREDDIGKSKSKVATEKILEFNDRLNIKSMEIAVGKDNENIFSRGFWDSQDIIVNALDNVEARQYVDSKCVLHKKPLFESGTLGPKCNIQVIIPYKTKSYSETRDPPEKSIPMCTVKNFPFKIEHCIEWSMEIFNKYFNELIEDVKELHKGKVNFKNYTKTIDNDSILYNKLKTLDNMTDTLENLSSENLARFARYVFDDLFVNPIKQLLHSFPLERTLDDGSKFWSGNKLPPKVIEFENYNKSTQFISIFTKLLCKCFGVKYDIEDISKINLEYVSDFKVSNSVKIKVKDSDETKEGDVNLNLNDLNNNLINKITLLNLDSKFKFNKEFFEKDDDNNGHVDMITSISNTRAQIYGIEETTSLECKLIAGKVIPALSTTTTLVTGLSIMEMLKYTYCKLNDIKYNCQDHFINSSINTYIQSEPQKATQIIDGQFNGIFGCNIKAIPQKFSNWDIIKLDRRKMGIVELNDVIQYIKDKYKVDIDMLCCDEKIVYNRYNSANINKSFASIYDELKLPKSEYLTLNISVIDQTGIPILLPNLVYCWDI